MILVRGPLLRSWPCVREQVRIADLALVATSQPRDEVVISGYVNNVDAVPFSLETLVVEDLGKQLYRRQMSPDADRAFELALGKPTTGTYLVAVGIRKPQCGQGQGTWGVGRRR